ncbi:hypothetical protein ACLOJK_026052 [Asimina triloba]
MAWGEGKLARMAVLANVEVATHPDEGVNGASGSTSRPEEPKKREDGSQEREVEEEIEAIKKATKDSLKTLEEEREMRHCVEEEATKAIALSLVEAGITQLMVSLGLELANAMCSTKEQAIEKERVLGCWFSWVLPLKDFMEVKAREILRVLPPVHAEEILNDVDKGILTLPDRDGMGKTEKLL